MQINARAKINWTLNVLAERADGYHELDMTMQSVDLCDELSFETADELSLTASGRYAALLPLGPDNLILRAARLLQLETGASDGAKIHIIKRIPLMAGLGGGSSDAAATLWQLNSQWRTGLDVQDLCKIGIKLGADIPYCLTGGLCRAEGLGERLTRFERAPKLNLIIAMPAQGLSTREVFANCKACPRQDSLMAASALNAGRWEWLDEFTANDLEPHAERLRPEIRRCIELMRSCGARFARMTGSGSAVYGVFDDSMLAAAHLTISRVYPECWTAHTLT